MRKIGFLFWFERERERERERQTESERERGGERERTRARARVRVRVRGRERDTESEEKKRLLATTSLRKIYFCSMQQLVYRCRGDCNRDCDLLGQMCKKISPRCDIWLLCQSPMSGC